MVEYFSVGMKSLFQTASYSTYLAVLQNKQLKLALILIL